VVTHLYVAKGSRLPMRSVESVTIEAAAGIIDDRYHGSRHRQVSVQGLEDLQIAQEAFGSPIDPGLTRRNITVSGLSVPRSPGSIMTIGDVVLEVVRVAAPCKLLDDTIGVGAQAALRQRGGSICRVLSGGVVTIGVPVSIEAPGGHARVVGRVGLEPTTQGL
jgi:MOSC domain-containing protein YiiM